MSSSKGPTKVLIQMSGAPGSGKSTLSNLLSRSLNAVVIDHDLLRTSFLDASVPFDQAAKHAYALQWSLVRSLAFQGHSIIVDSTCNYPEVLAQGSAIAEDFDLVYWYVECRVGDIGLLDRRLRERKSSASQRSAVNSPPAAAVGTQTGEDSFKLFKTWIEQPCRPSENLIILDSTKDLELLQDSVLKRVWRDRNKETSSRVATTGQ